MVASAESVWLAERRRSHPRVYTAAIFVLAVSYGLALASLPVDIFQDRSNYLDYVQSAPLLLLQYLGEGWLVFFTNEPLFLLLNAALGLGLEPPAVVRTLIFFSATTLAFTVLRTGPRHFIWLLLILVFPSVIKNYIIHLRQGLAISVFMIGWQMSGRYKRLALIAAAPFFHASFFFVLLLLGLTYFGRKLKLAADLRGLTYIFVGLAAAVSLGVVAQLLGARQGEEYEFAAAEISGLGFVFWLAVACIFATGNKAFQQREAFAMGSIIFYLCAYFFVEVSARIFESAMVAVLLAGLTLNGWRRHIYCAAIAFFAGMSWVLRLGQPLLGF
jgi:hypothetical protein